MAGDLVGIYLRDHLAGSVGALELMARARRENRGSELGAFLDDLHGQAAADQRLLLQAMERLGIQPSRVKNRLAWAAEKAGRLKLNGSLLRYSPLSRLVELELLAAGVTGKRMLWTALDALADPRLSDVDFPALVARAEDQIAALETWRRRAATALRAPDA